GFKARTECRIGQRFARGGQRDRNGAQGEPGVTVARRTRRSMTVAFAAAYMLVLQSLLGAFTFGMGTVGQTDAFGNVICTHAGPAEQPRPDPHQQTPSCCILGCAFSGLGLGTPP